MSLVFFFSRYALKAVLHHKNAHFTATLIGVKNNLYMYDDQKGVREVRASTDEIEMAIYAQVHEF